MLRVRNADIYANLTMPDRADVIYVCGLSVAKIEGSKS